jgi:hypothetical protein
MIRVERDKLEAGMALAKPIINDAGMVMLSEGSVLTDSMIKRLGSMEVNFVYIEGDAPDAKSKAELLADIEKRFRKTENEKYMSIIKNTLKARIEEVYK